MSLDMGSLHLQLGETIDMETYHEDKLNLIISWLMNDPVGNTLKSTEPIDSRFKAAVAAADGATNTTEKSA